MITGNHLQPLTNQIQNRPGELSPTAWHYNTRPLHLTGLRWDCRKSCRWFLLWVSFYMILRLLRCCHRQAYHRDLICSAGDFFKVQGLHGVRLQISRVVKNRKPSDLNSCSDAVDILIPTIHFRHTRMQFQAIEYDIVFTMYCICLCFCLAD